ncbi:MAG: hypothetical protein ACE5GW_02260 [Planctomycetota bacterium]
MVGAADGSVRPGSSRIGCAGGMDAAESGREASETPRRGHSPPRISCCFPASRRRILAALIILPFLPLHWCSPLLDAGTDVEVLEQFPAGDWTTGLCFHGGFLYAVSKSGTLRKYDPLTGVVLEVVPGLIQGYPSTHLHGMALGAGDTFWVGEIYSGTICEVRFSDYALVSEIPAPPGNPPFGLAFDGDHLWVGRHSDGGATPINVLDPVTGEILETFLLGFEDVHGLRFLGTELWLLDNMSDTIHLLDGAGNVLESYQMPPDWWGELAHDGTRFWTENQSSFHVIQFTPGTTSFRRGDANADGALDISDPIRVLAVLFTGGGPPPCEDALDANDDGALDVADAIILLGRLFEGGPPLPVPYFACGPDFTGDGLDCASYAPCP